MIFIPRHHTRRSGFTLVELAIVLFILAILLGGLLPTVSSQVEQQRIGETRKQLDEIQQALIGFAVVNGHLPCPAKSATDGAEDRTGASCAVGKRQGFVPWATLGTSKLDAWGRIFRYSVTPGYADSITHFNLNQARDITIKTRDALDDLINLSNIDDIPAVILSQGKNGYGAMLDNGTQIADLSPNNPDEDENYDITGDVFVSKDYSTRTTGSGEFDDIVVWISPNILFNRMVAAGKLP